MKALFAVLTFLLLGIVPTTNPTADDAEDVKREFIAHIEALRAGNIDGYLQRHHPQLSNFEGGGGVLREFASSEEQRAGVQALLDSGVSLDFQARDIHVKVFGEDAAILTVYIVNEEGTTRRSEMWVKEGGQWMEAHGHASPL